jgi:hypothetical protein
MVELSLRIIYDKDLIQQQERLINDLSRIYPICSYCKKVQEKSGAWVQIEKYIQDIAGTQPSHGICPDCFAREMKQFK